MSKRNHCQLLAILLATTLTYTGTVLASDKTATKKSPPPAKIELLFVQTAKSARIEKIANQKHVYKITLYGVNDMTTWFSERPQRTAGVEPTEVFIHNWNQGQNNFAQDNPNASLVSIETTKNKNATQPVAVVVLSNPVYNAKDRTLSYQIKELNNTLNHLTTLDNVALFIDNYSVTGFRYCIWRKSSGNVCFNL